jgi:hypothetical protein
MNCPPRILHNDMLDSAGYGADTTRIDWERASSLLAALAVTQVLSRQVNGHGRADAINGHY